ncbi:MAG: SusE domain-containing protein [Phocaeicola sp.]
MKNIYLFAMLFIGSLALLTSCNDDRDSNPTVKEPTTFVLNEPAYYDSYIDLSQSELLRLTCSQPDYGFTAAVTYKVEVSLTNSFTKSLDEAAEGESADYAVIDNSFTTCNLEVEAALVARAVMQLGQWSETEMPANVKVYTRLMANLGTYTIASNVLELKMIPYYVVLTDAMPEVWYLIGSCIGDGGWNNTVGGLGVSMFPMSHVKDFDYDKKTGQGKITYTGWLTPDGFKLVKTPGDWNDQWGSSDGALAPVKNDGGSSNLCVPVAGYYTVELDTKTDQLSVTAADITPATYTTMGFIGLNGDWDNDIVMAPLSTENNHGWYVIVEAAEATDGKFRANGGWDFNWGDITWPRGFGAAGGSNIPVAAGKYMVVFNDIDKFYNFIAL